MGMLAVRLPFFSSPSFKRCTAVRRAFYAELASYAYRSPCISQLFQLLPSDGTSGSAKRIEIECKLHTSCGVLLESDVSANEHITMHQELGRCCRERTVIDRLSLIFGRFDRRWSCRYHVQTTEEWHISTFRYSFAFSLFSGWFPVFMPASYSYFCLVFLSFSTLLSHPRSHTLTIRVLKTQTNLHLGRSSAGVAKGPLPEAADPVVPTPSTLPPPIAKPNVQNRADKQQQQQTYQQSQLKQSHRESEQFILQQTSDELAQQQQQQPQLQQAQPLPPVKARPPPALPLESTHVAEAEIAGVGIDSMSSGGGGAAIAVGGSGQGSGGDSEGDDDVFAEATTPATLPSDETGEGHSAADLYVIFPSISLFLFLSLY